MAEIKVLKIRNNHIIPLINWLAGQALPGKMSRSRNRVIKSLFSDRAQELPKEIKTIKELHCKKDKDGKPLMKEEERPNGEKAQLFQYTDEEKKKAEEEITEYLSEYSTFEILPSIADDMQEVKGIILNTTQTFKDEILPSGEPYLMATWYDEWCIALEVMDGAAETREEILKPKESKKEVKEDKKVEEKK